MIVYLFIAVLLLILELTYFKVADKYNIIDKPNLRSSHSSIVLRGGGIIFCLELGFMLSSIVPHVFGFCWGLQCWVASVLPMIFIRYPTSFV